MKNLKVSLAVAGISIIIVNTYTLFSKEDLSSFDLLARSDFFLWRQLLSLLSSFAFLISSVYLFSKSFGKTIHWISFISCVLGNLLLFTHEWTQIFFVRELAFYDPKALIHLENQEGLTLFDISAIASIISFVLGWILFLVWNQTISKFTKIIIISGFFIPSILTIVLSAKLAAFVGSLFVGVGFIQLYLSTHNPKPKYKSAI